MFSKNLISLGFPTLEDGLPSPKPKPYIWLRWTGDGGFGMAAKVFRNRNKDSETYYSFTETKV